MIKQFTIETLRDLAPRINEKNIHKDDIIQIVYTGDEKLNWVVIYWEK